MEYKLRFEFKLDRIQELQGYPNIEHPEMIEWFLGGDIFILLENIEGNKQKLKVTFSKQEPFIYVLSDLNQGVVNLIRGMDSLITLEDNAHTIRLTPSEENKIVMNVNYVGVSEGINLLQKEYNGIELKKVGHAVYQTEDIVINKDQFFQEAFRATEQFISEIYDINPLFKNLQGITHLIEKKNEAEIAYQKYIKN